VIQTTGSVTQQHQHLNSNSVNGKDSAMATVENSKILSTNNVNGNST
jgi:hypothetical protein